MNIIIIRGCWEFIIDEFLVVVLSGKKDELFDFQGTEKMFNTHPSSYKMVTIVVVHLNS